MPLGVTKTFFYSELKLSGKHGHKDGKDRISRPN